MSDGLSGAKVDAHPRSWRSARIDPDFRACPSSVYRVVKIDEPASDLAAQLRRSCNNWSTKALGPKSIIGGTTKVVHRRNSSLVHFLQLNAPAAAPYEQSSCSASIGAEKMPKHTHTTESKIHTMVMIASAFLVPLVSGGCDLEIAPTVQGQTEVNKSSERCSISEEAAESQNLTINNNNPHDGSKYRQFLLKVDHPSDVDEDNNPIQELGLCTVAEVRAEQDQTTIRMNATGFSERFGFGLNATTDISGIVTTHDCPNNGSLTNAFVECLEDDRLNTRFVVTAPHGGWIEPDTDDQAEYVYDQIRNNAVEDGPSDVTLWTCKGWHDGPSGTSHKRWHITSTDIGTQSFPKLASIADREFQYAVSFHGRSGEGKIVYVGGNAPNALKQTMKQSIEVATNNAVTVNVVGQGDEMAGTNEDNFVNWLTANGTGGIQLEQTKLARDDHWMEIAQGVVNAVNSFN